jgi:hypothetical protein
VCYAMTPKVLQGGDAAESPEGFGYDSFFAGIEHGIPGSTW